MIIIKLSLLVLYLLGVGCNIILNLISSNTLLSQLIKKVKASQLISKGPQDFNRRIARFKNFLFGEICDVLNITELIYKDKTFDSSVIKKGPFSQFAKDVNIDLYNALMSDNRVTALVRTMLDGAIKSNPIGNARAFDAFCIYFEQL